MENIDELKELYNSLDLLYKKQLDNDINKIYRQYKYIHYSKALGGSTYLQKITKIKCKKPDIELYDIFNFIQKLNDKRINLNISSCVYILLCENSKIYVGFSDTKYLPEDYEKTFIEAAKYRLEQHRNNITNTIYSNFTHIYSPISLLACFKGDKYDENLITKLISCCIDPNNVRGGIYSLPMIQYNDLNNNDFNEIINELFNYIPN